MITLDELSAAASHTGENTLDTVVLAIVDMQGRLQGKRFDARHFVETVAREGAEGCNYLLAVDVEMNTVDGYAMSSWAGGYGDFAMAPDLTTLRLAPWHPATAPGLADPTWFDGTPVAPSPRDILRRQLDRLGQRKPRGLAGPQLG